MRGRAAEWRLRLILAAFSSLLALAVAEIAARVLLRPEAPRAAAGTPISELSPTLGWRTRALGSQRIQRDEFAVTVTINSRGLRGPEIPYEAAQGRRRLAIVGDSFAHGYYADEPETLRGLLGSALESCRVDVLNAGGPGYSTDQSWLHFNEEVRKYQPAEVVLLFYYNDLLFNIEAMGTANREKPVFVEKDGQLELVRPKLAPVASDEPAEVPDGPPPQRGAPTFRHSALWAFAAARLQRSRPDWSRSLAEWGMAPELSTLPPAEFLPFGPINAGERARVENMWTRTEAILRGFRDDVRGGGAGFSVFYVPARFEVNDQAWDFVRRRYEPNRPWTRDAVRSQLEKVLVSLDIPLLESTDEFKGAEKNGPPAYLAVDGHWNARGNRIAFEGLLPAMRRAFGCGA
ncbi:MAG: SGNH/GDSL hydrolase family protein [Vicinamibacteria bacterium]|nr:SGNH/GDSL hydrolase family protein [Vicinamibacteria bacterium]